MRITLTAHARVRAFQRGVMLDMIQDASEHAERTGVGYLNRLRAYKGFEGRETLKVVFSEEEERIVVVTVVWE